MTVKTIKYEELRTTLKSNVRASSELQVIATHDKGSIVRYETLNFESCNKTTLLTVNRYINHAKKTWLNGWNIVASLTIVGVGKFNIEMF